MRVRDTVLFTAINILNYLDRYLVAAVLPLLIVEMSLTNEQAGRLVSAFVFGYFLFSPIFGWLGDRYPRPVLMAFGVFLWSLTTILTGFTSVYSIFLLVRVFVGIGEASFATIAPGYIKDWIKDPIRLNSTLAIFFAAIPVGSALGYVVGGSIGAHYSWQAAFFIGGIPGLILAIFLFRYKERRAEEVEKISLREGFRQISSIPMLWYAIGGYVLANFTLNGIAAFIAAYGMELGFTLDRINFCFGTILVVAGSCGTVFGGRLASRLARDSECPSRVMLRFVGWTAVCSVPFVVAAFFVQGHAVFLAMVFLAELLIFAGFAPVNSVIVLVCPPRYVTLTQGVTIFLLNLVGALISPVFVGFVADMFSLRVGMLSASAGILLGGIAWVLGANSKRK